MKTPLLAAMTAVLLLAGCASVPSGPSVLALPGTNRDYSEFRDDDMRCREYAAHEVGPADNDPAIRNAIIGTVIGAAAGAAIGDSHRAAGTGAGAGLLIGSLAGTETTHYRNRGTQRQYDNVYIQCMYGKGHRVPVSGAMTGRNAVPPPPPPPSAPADTVTSGADYPPPPAGMPPASPPPDYTPPR